MAPPFLTNLTPENAQLMSQLAAVSPVSLNSSNLPPNWFDPNYVPLVDQGGTIVGISTLFTVIALIAVILRVYARATQKERSLGLDDFTILPTMILAISLEVLNILDVYYGGAGRHTYDTTVDEFVVRYRYQTLITMLYGATTTFVKLSILSFQRRLFNTTRRWDYFFYVLYFLTIGLYICSLVRMITMCTPIEAAWNLRVYAASGAHCADLFVIALVFSILFAVSDVVLLVIPVLVVYKMNMRRKRKIGMICMFALGGLSCIFAIWKTTYLSVVKGKFDDAWWLIYVLILNSLEINLAIIICCVPALNTLYRRVKQQHTKTSYPSSGDPYDSPRTRKTDKPRDPLKSTSSNSDNTSSGQKDSQREPSLDIGGVHDVAAGQWSGEAGEGGGDLEKGGWRPGAEHHVYPKS